MKNKTKKQKSAKNMRQMKAGEWNKDSAVSNGYSRLYELEVDRWMNEGGACLSCTHDYSEFYFHHSRRSHRA